MTLGLVLRVALALVPIAWVAHKVDVATVMRGVATVGAPTFLATCLLPLASASVAPLRWRVLLRTYGAHTLPPLTTLWRHNLVGGYFNALPGAIAGDALRAVRTASALSSTADSATVVLVERLAGLVGLLLIGSTSLLVGARVEGTPVAATLGLGIAFAAGLAAVVFFSPGLYRRLKPEPPEGRLLARADGILRSLPSPKSSSGISVAVLLSLVTQSMPVGQLLVLSAVMAPEVSPSSVMLVLPAIILLTYVPITPAAVGQRELVYVHLLGTVGVAPEAAVGISLLVLAGMLVATLVGGAVHFVELTLGWEGRGKATL